MTDGVIKGTGNSRYIKFPPNMLSMYPDYDSYIADGVAGKLPVDFFGINPDGWKTLGTLLNKANLLSDATGAMLGLGSTGTVNSALAVLAKYNQYWWRRITIKSSSSSTVTVASTDLSYYYIFTYSDEITINGPNVILKTPTNYTGNPTNDTISALSFLVNKFFTYGGTIYYCTGLGTKTGSGTTSAPYVFTVKATPVTVGAEIYVQGNSEKTYPSYGHSGNYYYIPLGRPLDLFKTPSLAYMEYIGTGTYGEANPTSITFPFVPKLVYIFATPVSESDASSYNYIFPRYATKYFSSNGSAFFSIESVMWINTNPQYDVPIKAYVGDREKSGGLLALTFSGNTLSFFTKAMGDLINADARAQLNQANKKYSVFAFS